MTSSILLGRLSTRLWSVSWDYAPIRSAKYLWGQTLMLDEEALLAICSSPLSKMSPYADALISSFSWDKGPSPNPEKKQIYTHTHTHIYTHTPLSFLYQSSELAHCSKACNPLRASAKPQKTFQWLCSPASLCSERLHLTPGIWLWCTQLLGQPSQLVSHHKVSVSINDSGSSELFSDESARWRVLHNMDLTGRRLPWFHAIFWFVDQLLLFVDVSPF